VFAIISHDWHFAARTPPHSNLLIDSDRNIWVQHHNWIMEREPTTWSVFDRNGRWLGAVKMPAGFEPHDIDGSRVTGLYRDEMDARHVQVYGLVRSKE
jgi:hypothetical protein